MDFNDLVVRFLASLRRGRVLFILMFLAIFMGAVGGAYIKPARFESTATMMVAMQASRVKTTPNDQQQATVPVQAEEIMAAQVEIMQARDVTEELVDALPEWVFVSEPSDKWYVRLVVAPLKSAIEAVTDALVAVALIDPENERYSRIQEIEDGLTIFPVRKAHVIEISFSSKDPRVPPLVIEELLRIYRERATALQSSTQGFELYHERAIRLSEELAEAERARAEFLISNDLTDFQGEKQQLIARLQERRLKADEERLRELVSLEPQLNLLERNVAVLAESYLVYRKAADDRETFFERDNQISAQIIDPPTVIYEKSTQSRLFLVGIGLVAALVLATLIVLAVEWIGNIRRIYRAAAEDRITPMRKVDNVVRAAE